MLWLAFKLAFLLTLLAAMPIAFIRAQPYADAVLPPLLVPVDDCQTLCFMGIYPGQTTLPEAINRLRENEWVDKITVRDYRMDVRVRTAEGWVGWTWSQHAPPEIDTTRGGQLHYSETFGQSVVDSLYIPTRYRTALLQQGFGPPDFGSSGLDGDHNISYLMAYEDSQSNMQIKLKTVLGCPAQLMDYWHSAAEIIVTSVRINLPVVPPGDAMRLCS